MTIKPRKRKCKACKEYYQPYNSLQKACSIKCAKIVGKEQQIKDEKKENREAKARLNDTVPNWKKKAQQAFNEYIRLRDHDKPCVSCGKYSHQLTTNSVRGGVWDAGHYRSVGSAPELRFEPLNCHKQCKKCNNFQSGNHVEYRFGISARLTPEQLEWLEGPHEPKRYRVPVLKEIYNKYKALSKELKKEIECR